MFQPYFWRAVGSVQLPGLCEELPAECPSCFAVIGIYTLLCSCIRRKGCFASVFDQ